jgi:phosphomannomutase
MFFIDDLGQTVTGSETMAVVLDAMLTKHPEAQVLFNAICGWNVRDVFAKHGATGIRTKVGHAFIKNEMRANDAIFAGEHSGHYFYKESFCADSALITAVLVLELISKKDQKMSEILAEHRQYVQIAETNFRVANAKLVMDQIVGLHDEAQVDFLDGITVVYPDYWFNIRASMTEPLLRLNVEAKTSELLADKVAQLTAQITSLAQAETLPEPELVQQA